MVKKDKKSKKNVFLVLGVVLGAIIIFLAWFFYVGSPKEIVSVADQLKTNPEWELVSERIQPPRTVCIDSVCPSLSRQWRTDHTLSRDEFATLLQKSGWNLEIKDDCLPRYDTLGDHIRLCSAEGNINGYNVVVAISGSNPIKKASVGLSLSKR